MPTVRDLEVHHVQPRASATDSILPDGTSMNTLSNLTVLCEECHDCVHAGTLLLGPVQMTSDGPVREIQRTPPSSAPKVTHPLQKGKWTDEEVTIAMGALKQYSAQSLKSIRALLNSKYGLDMSESVLGKMRREL